MTAAIPEDVAIHPSHPIIEANFISKAIVIGCAVFS